MSDSASAPHVLTFGVSSANWGRGVIMSARLVDEASQATPGSFELYLFTAEPTAVNDNAALALSDADAENLLGVIPFIDAGYVTNAGAGAAGNVVYAELANLPFACAATDQNLYGLLVVRNAYTPVSGEKFAIQLGVQGD